MQCFASYPHHSLLPLWEHGCTVGIDRDPPVWPAPSRMMEVTRAPALCGLWSWSAVVKWSCGVIERCVEYECISTPLHWRPRLADLVDSLRFALQVSLSVLTTHPLHSPHVWHSIVRSCASSTAHRRASASFVSMISLRFVVLFATVHAL